MDIPFAFQEALKARDEVLELGDQEAQRIRQAGLDPAALTKFLTLVRLPGPWEKRETRLQELWVEASPLLEGAINATVPPKHLGTANSPAQFISAKLSPSDASPQAWCPSQVTAGAARQLAI